MNARALADAVTARVDVPQFTTYRSELITARPAKGYVVFWFGTHPGPWLAVGAAVFLLASAAYVLSRPGVPLRAQKHSNDRS